MIALAHIAACFILGALWRRCKGSTNGGPLASWTFAPMHALPLLPLCWALDPGKVVLAYILFCAVSALFLLVRADNGGNGHPLRRFGPFGLGYLIPAAWVPRVRVFGVTWVDAGEPTDVGELWLGATWFGFWSAAACAAASMEG